MVMTTEIKHIDHPYVLSRLGTRCGLKNIKFNLFNLTSHIYVQVERS